MEPLIIFVLITEEGRVLENLKKIIERAYTYAKVEIFENGLDGWDFIRKYKNNLIIIADYASPLLGGIQLCRNVKAADDLKQNYYLLMSRREEKEENLKAIQLGADDILYTPLTIEDVINKTKLATRVTLMMREIEEEKRKALVLQEEINKKADEIISVLKLIQKERLPVSVEVVERIVQIAVWICKESENLSTEETEKIVKAAEICFAGKLFLSDVNIGASVTTNGLFKNDKMANIPEFTQALLGGIVGLESVYDILYHLYENYDGSGSPEKLRGTQIPFGSRLLRILLDFEEISTSKKWDSAKVITFLEIESKRLYDPIMLVLFDQYQGFKAFKGKYASEYPITKSELKEGMTISRQIVTESGTKIMGAGTIITYEYLDRIRQITRSDPAIGRIYVKNV